MRAWQWVVLTGLVLQGCGEGSSGAADAGAQGPHDAVVETGTAGSDAGVIQDNDGGGSDATRGVDAGEMCPPALGVAMRRTASPALRPRDAILRMNQLQSLATHNSYHLRPQRFGPDWDYSHAPLDVQLNDQGVRGLELDLRWDAQCQRFRVYHLPIIDPLSTCNWFTDCLALIRNWSDAHSGHQPLFIQLEPKDAWSDATAEERLRAIETEILSVFSRELVITPDEVRGTAESLAAGLRDHGWPTLGQSRGRVLFAIDRSDNVREVYTHGGRDLTGRLMFIDADPGAPYAGYLIMNDAQDPMVPVAVRAGYIVRVFSWTAGSRPVEASEQEAALASGAQVISTDFPGLLPDGGVGARIPGGTPSRCNPLVAPMGCTPQDIESLP